MENAEARCECVPLIASTKPEPPDKPPEAPPPSSPTGVNPFTLFLILVLLILGLPGGKAPTDNPEGGQDKTNTQYVPDI